MNNFGPNNDAFRLSDAERNDAINQLARAVGEGRLTIEEFEDRSDDVMNAETRRDLVPVFVDIPAQPIQTEVAAFTAGEIERAREAGRKPKLGVALLATLGAGTGFIALSTMALVAESAVLMGGALLLAAVIPAVWIMLYVMKVGPDSWHMPSPRQIERQRMREIQAQTAEQRAQQKALEQQMWAQRRAQAGELTGTAMSLAKRQLDKWNKK